MQFLNLCAAGIPSKTKQYRIQDLFKEVAFGWAGAVMWVEFHLKQNMAGYTNRSSHYGWAVAVMWADRGCNTEKA